jgi:hypothetical protein
VPLACAGLITLLVIIYKGYSPSLVCAGSQVVLEVIFAGALCYIGLTGEAHRSDRCLLWSPVPDWSDRSPPPVWPVDTINSSFRGRKVQIDHLTYSPPSRRHQGPFTSSWPRSLGPANHRLAVPRPPRHGPLGRMHPPSSTVAGCLLPLRHGTARASVHVVVVLWCLAGRGGSGPRRSTGRGRRNSLLCGGGKGVCHQRMSRGPSRRRYGRRPSSRWFARAQVNRLMDEGLSIRNRTVDITRCGSDGKQANGWRGPAAWPRYSPGLVYRRFDFRHSSAYCTL